MSTITSISSISQAPHVSDMPFPEGGEAVGQDGHTRLPALSQDDPKPSIVRSQYGHEQGPEGAKERQK